MDAMRRDDEPLVDRRGRAFPVGGGGGGTPSGAPPSAEPRRLALRMRLPEGRTLPDAGGGGGTMSADPPVVLRRLGAGPGEGDGDDSPAPRREDLPRGRGRRGASLGSGTSCSGAPWRAKPPLPPPMDCPRILGFFEVGRGRAEPCSDTGGGGGSDAGAPPSPATRCPRYLRTM